MLFRRYNSGVQETVFRGALKGKGEKINKRFFPLDPWYFQFYDSFSKPQKGGNKGRAQRRQWERRSPLSLLAWFVSRNIPKLAPRLALVACIAWVIFFGGGKTIMGWWFDRAQSWADRTASGMDPDQREQNSQDKTTPAAGASVAPGITLPATLPGQLGPEASDAEILAVLFDQLRQQYNALDERYSILEAEHEDLLDQVASLSALVAVTGQGVTLRSGYTYAIGDVIDYGSIQDARWLRSIRGGGRLAWTTGRCLRLMRITRPSSAGLLESVTPQE